MENEEKMAEEAEERKPEEQAEQRKEMTPQERAAAVDAFFERKRAQVEGREAVPGTEKMGDEGVAYWMGLIGGGLEGESKGVMKAGTGIMGGAMGEAIKVAKAVQVPAQLMGWDRMHKYLTGLQRDWEAWRENEYGLGYDDWGTALGDVGAKAGEIAGSMGVLRAEGKAAAPIAGLAAFSDTWQQAREKGHGYARSLMEGGTDGMIHFLGWKAFERFNLNKLFKLPGMQGTRTAQLVQKGLEEGEKDGFSGLVRKVRNGSIAEVLTERVLGAAKAAGIFGVQDTLSSVARQYAGEDERDPSELTDEELLEKVRQWDDYEKGRPGALAPEEGRDFFEKLGVGLREGLKGAAQGAAMEGIMGAGELALTTAEAREQTAAIVRRMLETPKGRGWVGSRDPDAMGVVQDLALRGGKVTPELLDAAGLPPDMRMRDVRRLAHELERDVEEADRRAERETEDYRKRAELAERWMAEHEEGEVPDFKDDPQGAELERALQEREERLGEARADELVASGQGMADTMFGEEAGVLVRRGTAAERRAAAEGAVGKGADARTLKDAEGQVCGYWDRGKNEVVLFGNADAKTVAHELGWHATRQWAERNSPELLAKMNAYAQSCPAELRAEIEAAYPDFAKNPDALLDEIGAGRFEREMGEKFGEMLERSPEAKSWWQGLKDTIAEAWHGMVRGLSGKGAQGIDWAQLEGMKPEEGMEWLVEKMASGERIAGEGQGFDFASRGGAEARRVPTAEVKNTGDGTLRFQIVRNGKKKTYKRPEEALREFIAELDGVEMDAEQQGIYDVATGGKKTTDIRKDDLGNLIKLHRTGRNKGARKIINVHYAGKRGKVTAKEVIDMGLVIREGKLTFDGTPEHPASRHYEMMAEDGARLRVVVDLDKKGNESVINFYSDREQKPGAKASPGAHDKLTTSSEELYPGRDTGNPGHKASPGNPDETGADYSKTGGEKQGGEIRPQIRGIFTGTAADYANRSRQGGVDDGPSLKKIGTGEGSQVYGWGLYGSTVRGVAENYAKKGGARPEVLRDGKEVESDGSMAFRAAMNIKAMGSVEASRKQLKAIADSGLPQSGEAKKILEELEAHEWKVEEKRANLYEQTLFTDRAPGDESHLLKWYEPVSEEQIGWIKAQAEKDGVSLPEMEETLQHIVKDGKDYGAYDKGEDIYEALTEDLGSPQAASEFLARAGIDGVKYPVDSYGGKGVKDGDVAGWNYVSFRDDNIRVDHKWTDGEIRYSRKKMNELAKGKVGEWIEGITNEGLKRTIEGRIEKGLPEGEYRFKKPEDRKKLVAEAMRFYKRFSQKTVMLSDGRCVYFVPDGRAKAERGLSNEEAWAEYAIHAVTSSGEKLEGKEYRERLYNKTKAANIWRIENILKAERCEAQEATAGREAGIAFYGRGVDGKTIKVITRLDEADNIYADLSEVTVVTERKKKELPPRKPLAEVVGAVRKRGDLLTDDASGSTEASGRQYDTTQPEQSNDPNKARIIPQNGEAAQGGAEIRPQRKVTKEETDRIIEHFGTTRNINEAGYILPDGRMLDLSGKNMGATGGRRTIDHRDVWDVLDDRADGGEAMADFVWGGAIRIQPEANGIMFGAKPTEAQESAVLNYFRHFNGEMEVDIMAPNGDFITSASYAEGTRPQRILNEIKRYYDEGVEPTGTGEQADGTFRYQRRVDIEGEIERTRDALRAVRQGRVRVAATGGNPGSAGAGGITHAPSDMLGAGETAANEQYAGDIGMPGGAGRAFSMSMMVNLYNALRGSASLPRVLQEAKRRGAKWVSRVTGGSDVELNPEAFGIIDETDRVEVKDEMKRDGMFRNEDPVWNMRHSREDCDAERELSEQRLEDRLRTLAERRVRGEAPGGNRVVTSALAHEIGQLLIDMPVGEGLRRTAGRDGAQAIMDFKTLGGALVKGFEREWRSLGGDIEDPAALSTGLKGAVDAVAWWRGIVKSDAEYRRIAEQGGEEALRAQETEEQRQRKELAKDWRGLAGELFGMFLAAPEALRERAPDAYRKITEAIASNGELMASYERIAGGDAPTEVMAKIRAGWSHEAQVDLARLEREADSPLGTLWQRAKRRMLLNLHSKEGPVVSIVEDALRERVAAAKRALKAARKSGDADWVKAAERNLETVRKAAHEELVDLKMGVLKKQRGGGLERDYALNMLNRVFADIRRDGVNLEDLREYMKAKWCIALQGRADSYGLTPQEAQKALDRMRARLGEADWAKLESAQRRFGEERRRAILDNEDVVAAFGPALVDFWRKNVDYVRSERILGAQQVKEYRKAREEWLRNNPGQVDVLGDIELMVEMHRLRHGGSDGSVFAKPLEGSFKATKDPLAYTIANDFHILQFARRNALVMQLADLAAELKMEGFKEIEDAGLGRALEGSNRYGSVAFMRRGERKLLIMPKVAAEGFRRMEESDVAGLVKANRAISAVLTQYSPRFAWRNMFRNRQAVENNIPWMRESRLRTATRYFGVGPLANLAEHLLERAAVRLPDAVARNWATNLIWGENTTMYWIGEATRIAKLMFDPKGIRNLAERADAAAANGDMAAAQAIMEEIAKARDMMKKPIFAGQWRMMMGEADRADIDSVFRALDLRTDLEGERYGGLRKAARAAKDLADTVRRFNTFEEARIKIVAELAAERARNSAVAAGKEFDYSQKEVDYLVATMAGSPRYEQRGRWMNVLEAIPLGPFANVGMKGAWRTVESMRTDPKAWWGKAAHRIAGRMAEVALWSAGGYALVAAIARRMFGDDEEKQKVIDGFESFGRRMARARACVSDYRLRNYDIVPLGLYGEWCSFGINMPRGDEDRLIMPFTDLVARELTTTDAARRAGLHDPIDGAYTPAEAAVATAANSGLAPDIYRGSMIWNLGRDVLYAWFQNPYNTFTGRNQYGKATWENRWDFTGGGAKEFFVETMKQAWNDIGGQVMVPATTWDEDAGDVPDDGKWVLGMADPKDAMEMPVGGKTIFRALHYVPMASAALSGMFYMNCDGDSRIARRLEKMQAHEKAARDGVAMMCVRRMLQTGETAVDYAPVLDAAIQANGWDSMDRALIEQAIARKVKEAAKKMGRENKPILEVFRKVNIGNRERHEMERYLAGVGWEE